MKSPSLVAPLLCYGRLTAIAHNSLSLSFSLRLATIVLRRGAEEEEALPYSGARYAHRVRVKYAGPNEALNH